MTRVGIVLTSHNKQSMVKKAIQSVASQTHEDWRMLIYDSGYLLEYLEHLPWGDEHRVDILETDFEVEQSKQKNMASWCQNRGYHHPWLQECELLMCLCDDDYLNPEAFEAFVKFYEENRSLAMYGSEEVKQVGPSGDERVVKTRIADVPRGSRINGPKLDCEVDYLQFCHHRDVLRMYEEAFATSEYYPEGKMHAWHADGIFMERVGSLVPVMPVNCMIGVNRRTPESVNIGTKY